MKQFITTLSFILFTLLGFGQTRTYLFEEGKVEVPTKSQPKWFNSTVDSLEYYFVDANVFRHMQGVKIGELAHGEAVFYDAVGNIIAQGTFRNGLKQGRWIKWNKKGEIIEIAHWKNGLLHGNYKKIYRDKKVELGSWKKNRKVGTWTYSENGTIVESIDYSGKRSKRKKAEELEKIEFQESTPQKEETAKSSAKVEKTPKQK